MNRLEATSETPFERLTRLVGLYVLAPLLLLLTLPVGVNTSRLPDWGMKVSHLVVVTVAPGGPAALAGIARGDRVRGVDGQIISSMVDYYAGLAGDYELSPRSFLLQRDGRMFSAIVKPQRPSHAQVIWGYNVWISGLAFLFIGWWVLYRRYDSVARNFFMLSLIFAFFLGDVPDWPSHTYMTVKETLRDLLELLLAAFFLRFLLHFPSWGPLTAEQKKRHRLLLLPAALLFLLSLYAQVARLDPATSRLVIMVQYTAFFYFAVYFIAGLAIFARKVLRRDRPIQHTKMRVVLLGLVCGLTPFLACAFLASFYPDVPLPHWEWLGFSLPLVPLSFGLAILRYGALDTAFVIRHGLTYAALTLLLVLAYFVVVGQVGRLLETYFRISTYPLVILVVAGGALAIMPARRFLQGWIDRAFYPERRANRAAILTLGHELAGLIDSQSAAKTLLDRLAALYRPERISLFLWDGQSDELQEFHTLSGGQPARPVFSLTRNGSLARYLDRARRPIFAEDFEESQLVTGEAAETSGFLERLGCELLVPLVTGNQLSGLLALGPKGNTALYTQDDLANLQLLSVQAAALLESRRLYQESLARRQLETELSVAKEIQSQLIPTSPLTLPGVCVCGRMDSCREVGGDYFDYFPVDSHMLAIAIADVAGKGIPAALLMSTLRVAFHAEAVRLREPARVMARLNRSFSSLTTAGQFVCFFYGLYDLQEHTLRYCNAGMNPPLLFRKGRTYLETLGKGGPVLGVNPDQHYRSGTLILRDSDLLLGFSDGVIEQTNEEGQFFDEERLVATVRDWQDRPLEELREAIFRAVSDFGGAGQSDDRTVVLLQIHPAAAAVAAA